jgi:chromosomal replication initiator protein
MPSLPASEWEDIVGHLRVNHPDLARGWFAQLEPVGLNGGVLQIRARNPAQVDYLRTHCRLAFLEAAQATLGRLVTARFEAEDDTIPVDPEAEPLSFESSAGLTLNDDYTFEHFVVGPGNRLAHAAAVAVAESPGRTYNPLFLHGDVGLGKTHLMQAICHASQGRDPAPSTLYISCETFTNHFIEAVERGALNQFRFRYRYVGMLVIDDIQFLGERERSQEEFFHTFNTLYQSQKQIVLSADCLPPEIPSLENRLVSRFNSGLVASIDRPCLETRMAIVRKKAKLRCIEIPEEVIKLVASRIESNIRDIEGALVKLDALSQTRSGRINLDLAVEALGTDHTNRAISVHQIADVVTRWYGVRLADLQSKKRTKSITQPRQLSMYLARELTNHSLEEIGRYFGGRDHTTVLHAIRLIDNLRNQDEQLRTAIEKITGELKGLRPEVA